MERVDFVDTSYHETISNWAILAELAEGIFHKAADGWRMPENPGAPVKELRWTQHIDPRFVDNWQASVEHGFAWRGAYGFPTFDFPRAGGPDIKRQVEYLEKAMTLVNWDPAEDLWAADMEQNPAVLRAWNITPAMVSEMGQEYIERGIEMAGIDPWIYTGNWWWTKNVIWPVDWYKRFRLWISAYALFPNGEHAIRDGRFFAGPPDEKYLDKRIPFPWNTLPAGQQWVAHQYSDQGLFPGLGRRFFDVNRLAEPLALPEPEPLEFPDGIETPEEQVYYLLSQVRSNQKRLATLEQIIEAGHAPAPGGTVGGGGSNAPAPTPDPAPKEYTFDVPSGTHIIPVNEKKLRGGPQVGFFGRFNKLRLLSGKPSDQWLHVTGYSSVEKETLTGYISTHDGDIALKEA